jgi:hypothetical protein
MQAFLRPYTQGLSPVHQQWGTVPGERVHPQWGTVPGERVREARIRQSLDTRVESKCEYDTRFEWCYTLRNPILRKWN